jgi:hypothetical protein
MQTVAEAVGKKLDGPGAARKAARQVECLGGTPLYANLLNHVGQGGMRWLLELAQFLQATVAQFKPL